MPAISIKHIYTAILVLSVILIFTIPDVLIELIVESAHLIIEIVVEVSDVIFEAVESMLDQFVEHTFHTELHDTQIIVFYIIFSVLMIPTFFIARLMPRAYYSLAKKTGKFCENHKLQTQLYWLGLSRNEKIKLGFMILGGLYIASFFIM